MKRMKFLLVFALIFSLNLVSVSAQGQEKEELYGLTVLSESIETSVLDDGTKVTSIKTELDGNLEDLKRILESEKELKQTENEIVLYNKFSNITPASIPQLDAVNCYSSEDYIMTQCVGTSKGIVGSITNLDTKWTVVGNVTTYQVANPGKTASNLSTTPRMHVTVWGLTGADSIVVENNYFEGTAGTSSASWGANLSGNAAIIHLSYRPGGDFSFKSGTRTYSNTHWW